MEFQILQSEHIPYYKHNLESKSALTFGFLGVVNGNLVDHSVDFWVSGFSMSMTAIEFDPIQMGNSPHSKPLKPLTESDFLFTDCGEGTMSLWTGKHLAVTRNRLGIFTDPGKKEVNLRSRLYTARQLPTTLRVAQHDDPLERLPFNKAIHPKEWKDAAIGDIFKPSW